MDTVTSFLTHDHRHCDDHYHAQEQAVAQGDWGAALSHFQEFQAAMERHFRAEEDILFPAFEERTGSLQGPTQVMRKEHGDLRELLQLMEAALVGRADEEYAGVSETLNILLQQHNMKEENILYPMIDRAFPGCAEDLVRGLMCSGPRTEAQEQVG